MTTAVTPAVTAKRSCSRRPRWSWPDTFVNSTVGVGPSSFAVNTVRIDSGDSVKT